MIKGPKDNNSILERKTKRQQKVRLVDIAQHAGVSVSSVSRIIRGVANIDDDIQERVEASMDYLNIDRSYFSKKDIKTDKFKFIALNINGLFDPSYTSLVKGIEDVANMHQYEIMINNMPNYDQDQYHKIKMLTQDCNLKGIIHVPNETSGSFIDDMLRDNIPLVLVGSQAMNQKACYVACDDRMGAYDAVKYLISLGHRKIMYLAGDARLSSESARYAGYCDALSRAGIPIEPYLRAEGFYDFHKAYDSVVAKIIQDIYFTAIFCANDVMAFAAKKALEENGYSVPEDISLMGFDQISVSSTISLTTCSRPTYELGRSAMLMLIDLMNDRITPPNHVIFNPTIKIRNSCCRKNDKKFEDTARAIASGRTIRIGYAPPTTSEFYDIIKHGAYTMMKELTERFDVKFEFDIAAPNGHHAVESQVAIIEKWIANKYDAILVCSAGDIDIMNPVYEKAKSAGTAIYMFNMPSEMWSEADLKVTSIISYNNHFQAGNLIGKYAVEKLNQKGKVALILGLPGHWSTSRREGFMEAVKPYPEIQIVSEGRGEYIREKGMQATIEILEKHPDVDLIYGENEEMAIGAVQAIEKCGLKHWDGTKGIITIGADGLKSGYEYIREGKLTATVNVAPVDQGREFIMAVFMHEALGYSVDKIINLQTTIVDKSNVDIAMAYTDWALGTEYPLYSLSEQV